MWVASGVLFKIYLLLCISFGHICITITCQQNDYLSINGHQKTKEMSKFKKIVNFRKGIGIERYTQFTTVTLIMKKYLNKTLDRYNNRLTVHAYTIAKATTVCFYWGLIHGPVWRPWVLRWSVNGSNLPGQADSPQGITTRLADETGHRSSYILWHVELKTAWIEAIWP